MKNITESQILTDPAVNPENNILEEALGKKYKLFTEFVNKIGERDFVPEWHYYNDTKSWLCKILRKKKNHCWLSVWNTGFKLTFYFTEKTIDGVCELAIDEKIKQAIPETKHVGKLRPVILLIENKNIMNDGLKILEYKFELK